MVPGGFYARYKFESDLSGSLFTEAEKYPYVFCEVCILILFLTPFYFLALFFHI